MLVLPFSAALEASLSRPQARSRAEKGLTAWVRGNYLIALASRLRETVRRVREETPQSSPRRTQLMWTTTSGVIALILAYRSHSMAALVGAAVAWLVVAPLLVMRRR